MENLAGKYSTEKELLWWNYFEIMQKITKNFSLDAEEVLFLADSEFYS